MPNYCDNVLNVKGPYKDVMNFFSKLSKGTDTFEMKNLIVPSNPERDSYIKAWGCKWDISDVSPDYSEVRMKFEGYEEDSEEEVYQTIFYQTPWSPNEVFIKNVSSMFDTLTFTIGYYEPGFGFVGQSTYIEGDCTENIYHERVPGSYSTDEDKAYFDLAIELDLESADFLVNDYFDEDDLEEEPEAKILIDYLANKYNIEKHYEEDDNGGILNLTSKLIESRNLPDPE